MDRIGLQLTGTKSSQRKKNQLRPLYCATHYILGSIYIKSITLCRKTLDLELVWDAGTGDRIKCPLSISTSNFDLRLVSGTGRVCGTRLLSDSEFLGRVALVRGVAADSHRTFPWTICRSVRRSVQCIVVKRRIESGCRLVS